MASNERTPLASGYGAISVPVGNEPSGKTLFTRELDRKAVVNARRMLLIAAVIIALVAVGQFVGAVFAYSLALLVNSTSYLVLFSRLLFLAFLLQCAGRPATRLAEIRRHKIELYVALLVLLVAWLIAGGALFVAVVDTLSQRYKQPRTWNNDLANMITAGGGVLFALIVFAILAYGRYVSGGKAPPKRRAFPTTPLPGKYEFRSQTTDSAHGNSIAGGLEEFGRERGLLLRRTLKHVPMRPYLLLTLWFVLQCVLALAGALVIWAWPSLSLVDPVLAFVFVPLAALGSLALLDDAVGVMTEGILQGVDFSEVAETLMSIDGVISVKNLRIWALTMDKVSISVVLHIERDANVDAVLNRASAMLRSKYDVFEYNIDTDRDRLGREARRMQNERARTLSPQSVGEHSPLF